ncbi:MAG TPA: RodZ domain-containing protein [Nitrospirales bacterium]|jgi:cytoskeletal protein RodZ
MAESLGQYLREAREKKGWTLEQAAFKTRILYQYLKAVEDDNYEQLPAEVFAKGFVRSYARLLGLDELQILPRFDESGGQFYAKRDEREQLTQRIREEARRKKTNKLIVAGMVSVALVVLLLVTGHDRNRARPRMDPPREPPPPANSSQISPPSQSEAPTRPEPVARSESPAREAEQPATIEVERNFSPLLPLEGIVPDGSKLVLEVEAMERAWILVQADQDPPQEVTLSPGERVRWSAEEKLRLTLGNAGGVRVSLNGKPQGPYGASGKVVKDLVFTR